MDTKIYNSFLIKKDGSIESTEAAMYYPTATNSCESLKRFNGMGKAIVSLFHDNCFLDMNDYAVNDIEWNEAQKNRNELASKAISRLSGKSMTIVGDCYVVFDNVIDYLTLGEFEKWIKPDS
jgi:hypothetical protein